ncbi:MAG: DUF4623 domain-containing protein [Bacteroidia bacterium]|jgi:hypothetical protein|nr:DUF4623 domain-containing protein [Bacteroidia bacterium]
MKNFTLKAFQMWSLLVLMTATVFAQTGFEPVTILIDKSAETGNLPPMINSNANNRGAGFNGQYVFVASRQDGNHVYYWNIDNPATPSELDLTSVAGGTFTLSDLTVVGNHVFVSNMTFAGGEFKVYHWNGLTAQPSVLLSYSNAPSRLGDAISIIGNPETNALLVASGHGTKNFYVWNIASGTIANPEPTVYNFPNIAGANFGRITKVMNEDLYLASGSQFGLQLLSPNMDTLASVQAGYFPYWSMYPYIFYYNAKRYLAYIHVKDAPAENKLYVLDISEAPTTLQAIQTMMTVPFANRVVYELSLGANANGNASVGLDVFADANNNILMMAYAAANGFVALRAGNASGPSFGPVTTVMDKTKAGGNLPTIINNAGNNRGATFNGQKVFVASRQDGNHVYHWDISNPDAAPEELDLTGVSGGTFTLSDAAWAGNSLFVSNMAFAGGEFKVYKWDNLSGPPSTVLSMTNAPARLGDAFTVLGNPAQSAKLIASGHGTKNFYTWNITGGNISNPEPVVNNFPNIAGANFGRITKVMNEDLYLASGSQFGLQLLSPNMDTLASVQAGYFPYWSIYPHIFYYNGKRYLAYIHIKDAPAENKLYVLDISQAPNTLTALQTMMDVPFADRVVHMADLGDNANGNASAGLDVLADAGGNLWIMAYAAANGFIVQKVGNFPVGIAENSPSLSFNMFPNPAGNQITIATDKTIDKIEILDMAGRLHMQLQPAATEVRLNTASLRQGVYMVRVSADGAVSTRKLLINR